MVISSTASASTSCPPSNSPSHVTTPRTKGAADNGARAVEVGSAFVDANPPDQSAAVRPGEVNPEAIRPATVVEKEDPLATVVAKETLAPVVEKDDKNVQKA